jgi:hypothetical protein
MANEVNINKTTNTVNVTNEQTKVIRVTAQGPQGQKGDTGPTGPQGPQGISAFSGSAESSSISTRLSTAESELGNTLISSSAQIASDISGSFTSLSGSLSTRLTTDETNITNLQTDSGSFSTRITTAETELENTLISSSAAIDHDQTTNFVANKHIDHSSVTLTAGDGLSGGGDITTNRSFSVDNTVLRTTGDNVISSSAQISSDISGSFTNASSSFSTRITTAETELSNTLISSSVQIASDISGSSNDLSSSLSTRLTTDETNITNLQTDSGSFSTRVTTNETDIINLQTDSGSFSTRITTAESELGNTLISSSAQISSDISGSFTAPSASFSTRITTAESELGNTLISSSAQIASDISGSSNDLSSSLSTRLTTDETNITNLQTDSGSFSSRITTEETNVDNLQTDSGSVSTRLTTLEGIDFISSSAQISSDISGSFTEASASFSTRITTAETELSNTLISSSAQISSDISGSFVQPSSSFSTRVTTLETDLSTEQTNIDNLQTDSGSFSTRITNAETELNNTLISSSAQIASDISGSFVQPSSSFSTRVTTLEGIPFISSSAQIASDISGSFTAGTGVTISSGEISIGQDVGTTANVDFGSVTTTGNVSVGGNLDVSGTTTSIDSATLNIGDKNITIGSGSTTSVQLDGGGIDFGLGGTIANLRYQHSTTSITSSVDFRAPNFYGIFSGALSSSAQISSDISGSFTAASSSFSTRITTAETELDNTLFSGSAQVDHDLTTNFVSNEHIDHSTITLTAGDGLSGGGDITTNRSFAVDATVLRTNSGVISSSAQIASDISGSFTSGFEFTGTISGSSTSTGSFGYVIGDAGGLTNLPSAAITSYTNSGDNKIITSVDSVSVQGEDNLTFNGSVLNVTGDMTITGDVSGSSTSTGSFGHLIGGSSATINGFTFPVVDGTDGQTLVTDGSGVLSFDDVKVVQVVKNISGATLQKGTPVHAVGSVGNTPTVIAASASDATTMPATFVLDEQLVDDEEGRAIGTGFINGVNTVGFIEGGVVYVGEDGGYTQTKPTGTNLIQNLGIVTKIDANGSGFIYGSGRSNDVPNLLDNTIFYGSGSNQMQQIHISGALQDTTLGYAIFNDRVEASSFTGSLLSTNGVLSSSAQIASDISGSFVEASASFSTRITTEETNVDNLQTDSGSFSTRVTTNETNITNLQTDSGSFSTRVTTLESQDVDDDLTIAGDTGGNLTIDLDSETLTLAGGTGVATAGSSNTITFNSVDSEIIHDNLSGFVSNEHIDHSSVSITAGNGLTGGGTIVSTRTINVGAGDGISVAADSVAVDTTVLRTTGDNVVSSSAQIASDISGSFTAGTGLDLSSGQFSVDVSDFMSNGVDNRVLTATGTDAINAESGLTYDGSNLDITGNARATGDVIAFYSSDKRLKDNIIQISNPIEKIKSIGGYEFDWNDNQSTYEGHDIGVIAQEIEEVLPELVTTRDTGYKAVKYEKIIALLIEGIKEQQKQIDEIKNKL